MKNLNKIITTCLLLILGTSAQAFRVVLDPVTPTNATHILELDIGGTSWDITFVSSPAATVAPCPVDGGTFPCDIYATGGIQDETGARLAVEQIARALNEDISIGGDDNPVALTVGPSQQNQVLVPWRFDVNACFDAPQVNGTCAENAVSGGVGSWFRLGTAEILATSTVDFARFSPGGTVAIVPVPPAAWLFGSALGMLGWVRRRTRLSAAALQETREPRMA